MQLIIVIVFYKNLCFKGASSSCRGSYLKPLINLVYVGCSYHNDASVGRKYSMKFRTFLHHRDTTIENQALFF